MSDIARCSLCGEPMPEGEQMFKYHGYSGPCPKPPLPRPAPEPSAKDRAFDLMMEALEPFKNAKRGDDVDLTDIDQEAYYRAAEALTAAKAAKGNQ
jgi:hypothetical protein